VNGFEATISHGGGWLIGLNVFLQQIGVPFPAEPTLLVAGSLSARARLPIANISGAVLLATLIADLSWFIVGRRYGKRALDRICQKSPGARSRLTQIERRLERWGTATFVVAKFIPGLPMAGPALAGALGVTLRAFLFYDLLAMTLWAGTFTGLGMAFHGQIDVVSAALDRIDGSILMCGAIVLIALLLRRWQRATVSTGARRPLIDHG
jgi:membrane protein DedA with SNARE-associated domain